MQFASFIPVSLLTELATDQRERIFTQSVTFWAWMSQVLNFNASCSFAVSQVQSWRAAEQLTMISSSTASYSDARQKLPVEFIENLGKYTVDKMNARTTKSRYWKGLQIYSVDGSSVQLMDTLANQVKYPQPSNQKKNCGFPVMKFLALLNHSSGAWEHHVTAHPNEHDSKTMHKLIDYFSEPCLLLADRAFCTFEIIQRLKDKKVESLMRLHQMRAKGFTLRKGKRIGKNQRLVTWVKPRRKPKGSNLSDAEWEALEDEIEMRIMVCWYEDRNGEKKKMILATTLLDPEKYDWVDLINLYAARWDIELRLRDVKTTMKMEALDVKTPEMAEKALAMALLGFNLVKAVAQEASQQEGVDQDLISFKGALDWINSSRSLFKEGVKKTKNYLASMYRDFLETVSSKLINVRPYRWEPRAIKKRPKPFPLLHESRSAMREKRDNGELIPALT